MKNLVYHTPLLAPDLRELGIPAPWGFGSADRVRFGEIDALNHVNHTAYLSWFESFRIMYFREYGLSDYGPTAPRIVLKSIEAEFIKEMTASQDYVITGRTTSFRNTSWVMEYGVWTDKGLQASGGSVLVQLTRDGSTKLPLSETVKSTLMSRDNAKQL